jgi:catechol 2,3-dioxygenase-like lactoylglutathione lyase family enzyme
MIDHLSLGVRDLAASRRFYDAALAPLGYRCLSEDPTSLGYGRDAAVLWLLATGHPAAADPRPGLHVCFKAHDAASVDAFHAAALAQGGLDHGAPGLRIDYGPDYYAAFVVDPDGYRLEAHVG